MDTPISPGPGLSPTGSASSSTLVVTPNVIPHPKLRERCGINLSLSIDLAPPMQQPGKGHLQPHVSNLPRRIVRKKESMLQMPAADKDELDEESVEAAPSSPSPASTTSSASSSSLSRSPRPSLSSQHILFRPISVPPASISHHSDSNNLTRPNPKGHIQPHIGHLPRRRRKVLQPAAKLRIQRKEQLERHKRRYQYVGGGVWVAFESNVSDHERTGEIGGEKLELDKRVHIRAVVSESESTPPPPPPPLLEDDGRTLILYIPLRLIPHPEPDPMQTDVLLATPRPNDNGITHLTSQQIRAGCDFLLNNNSSSTHSSPPHILITTPPDHAVDAMSLAVSFLVLRDRRLTPTEEHGEDAIHRVLVGIHDAGHDHHLNPPQDKATETKGEGLKPKPRTGFRIGTAVGKKGDDSDSDSEPEDVHGRHGGLQLAWRGVVSREGIEFLGGVIADSSRSLEE